MVLTSGVSGRNNQFSQPHYSEKAPAHHIIHTTKQKPPREPGLTSIYDLPISTTLVLQDKENTVMYVLLPSARVDPGLAWKGLPSLQNNPGTGSVPEVA